MNSGKPSNEFLRLCCAFGYSLQGLRAALSQPAFRTELIVGIPMCIAALFIANTGVERALLIGSIFIVWIAELLNTAVEAAIDRIGAEIHPLSKIAKDVGSAAVLMGIFCAGAVWLLVLVG